MRKSGFACAIDDYRGCQTLRVGRVTRSGGATARPVRGPQQDADAEVRRVLRYRQVAGQSDNCRLRGSSDGGRSKRRYRGRRD